MRSPRGWPQFREPHCSCLCESKRDDEDGLPSYSQDAFAALFAQIPMLHWSLRPLHHGQARSSRHVSFPRFLGQSVKHKSGHDCEHTDIGEHLRDKNGACKPVLWSDACKTCGRHGSDRYINRVPCERPGLHPPGPPDQRYARENVELTAMMAQMATPTAHLTLKAGLRASHIATVANAAISATPTRTAQETENGRALADNGRTPCIPKNVVFFPTRQVAQKKVQLMIGSQIAIATSLAARLDGLSSRSDSHSCRNWGAMIARSSEIASHLPRNP
jgi:hypothetical protein